MTLGESETNLRLRGAWDEAVRRMREAISEQTYEHWIRPLNLLRMEGGNAVVSAPGEFGGQWVTKKFAKQLAVYLSEEYGASLTLRIVVDPDIKPKSAASPKEERTVKVNPRQPFPRPEFQPRFTFDRFVQGPSNRLALAGARAVGEAPGKKYNPLFIYGGPGLGKTHLMHAIGHDISGRAPDTRVAYLTGQVFAEEFVRAIKSGRIEEFRRFQRSVDVWLVDDVQFIAGKDRTQEELFHTFNSLYETGRQIVICSDRPPRELYLMEERLCSRFECGLVADVGPPDFETRAAILIKKAEDDGITLPIDVVYLMADRIQSNIRTLEGSLCRLIAECSLNGASPTVESAERILKRFFIDVNAEKPTPEKLIEAAALQYGVTAEELLGNGRRAPVSQARQAAVYLCREIWQTPWKQLGSIFNKDHTSAIYAHRSVGETLVRDPKFQTVLDQIVNAAQSRRT